MLLTSSIKAIIFVIYSSNKETYPNFAREYYGKLRTTNSQNTLKGRNRLAARADCGMYVTDDKRKTSTV